MCAVNELESGWVVGASVVHPLRPKTQLLAPNTELTDTIIKTLKRLKVDRVWIVGDGLADFDSGATRALNSEQRQVYEGLMEDFAGRAKTTVSHASLQGYKQRMNDLLMCAVGNRKFASLASRLRGQGDELFAHAASVCYLSVVCGLELEAYIIRERSRVKGGNALDHASLGLAGLLHDIGKTNCDHEVRTQHDVTLGEDEDESAYREHVQVGYQMLDGANAPASARVAVRMHHTRWDGTGWPDGPGCGLRDRPTIEGRTIHVFSRIVAAANVLDNLLTRDDEVDGGPRAPVEALMQFASHDFDGWFDPVVRTAMLRAVQPFAVGSRVVLTDGTVAMVAAPNPNSPCLPSVQALDAESEIIDLASDPEARRIAQHEGRDVSSCYYEAGAAYQEGDELAPLPPVFEDRSEAAA